MQNLREKLMIRSKHKNFWCIFSVLFLFLGSCSFTSKTVKQSDQQCKKIILSSEPPRLEDFSEQLDPKVLEKLKNICAEVKDAKFLPDYLPCQEAAKSLSSCSSEDLYYGIKMPVDFIKARECAFLELADERGPFSGRSMLMTIYANGKGVEQNLDLALKLACDGAGAWSSAEYSGRIEHLAELRKAPKAAEADFNICDDLTSTSMLRTCEKHYWRIESAEREVALLKMKSLWSSEKRLDFAELTIAAIRYFSAVSDEELGPKAAVTKEMSMHKYNEMGEEFINDFIDFERGKFPQYSSAQFEEIDRELNQIYKRSMQTIESAMKSGVDSESIKKVQRLWIKYRDAWVNFAAKYYPQVSDESIKAWLTEKRIGMLTELLGL